LLGLDRIQTLHALGIAEYHGPRSQMMRVIDHPTMLKDGSGWGAMVGVSAAYLAADGFTGAPAVTVTDPALTPIWSDLGTSWIIDDQYFKPYPICRWAQPAVEAALSLLAAHPVEPEQIAEVQVHTLHEAARLTTALPATTEEAQYSLPFPVAAALWRGRLTAVEVTEALDDAKIRDLSTRVTIVEDDRHNAAFPGRRYGRVTVVMNDGRRHVSADHEPRGEPESPLGDGELLAKFHALADPVLGERRAIEFATLVDDLDRPGALQRLLEQLAEPIEAGRSS
jgi:2-methylcitrate dehydratase PrpD